MRKKISIALLALMVILPISTASTDVNAIIQDNYLEKNTEENFQENTVENFEENIEIDRKNTENIEEKTENIEENFEENIQKTRPNLGDALYSISEAQEFVEPNIEELEEEGGQRFIDGDKPMIAITYDDGPSQYTPEILDVLKENNSVATFFVLGSRVYNNEDILNRMIEEGNQIGNHTYNHKDLTTISDEELYRQVEGTDDLIYIATEYKPSVMRPPYGRTNAQVNEKILKPIVNWSIDTLDWENRDSEMIVDAILKDVKDGDIILMHDLYESTAQASRIVIPQLIEMGYQLVTIDELFEYRQVTLVEGEQYYRAYK